jgi:hypothetical protein
LVRAIHESDRRETPTLDPHGFAAGGVLENVPAIVAGRPSAIRASHVGAVRQRSEYLVVLGKSSVAPQLNPDSLVDLLAASVIR